MIGKKILHYKILKKLGEGGFSKLKDNKRIRKLIRNPGLDS